jgi:hypothetical protein
VSHNPFSTRYTRPGAIPFFFPPGQNAEGLVERLRSQGWRGTIVGPHGSGKSSLVSSLLPALQAAGRELLLIELHDGERRLPIELRGLDSLTDRTVIIVDGYEQLSWLNCLRLRSFCRHRGCGLVVTSHKPRGLPPLCQTFTSPELARQIVAWLLRERPDFIDAAHLGERFDFRCGDLRELLFDLYDVYEQQYERQSDGSA